MENTGWILMHDYGAYEGLAVIEAEYNYSHYEDENPPKVYTDKAEAEARRDHLSKIWGSDGEITLIEVALPVTADQHKISLPKLLDSMEMRDNVVGEWDDGYRAAINEVWDWWDGK